MNTKKLLTITLGISALALASGSNAQHDRTAVLDKLNLEPEQQTQVQEILQEQRAKTQELIGANRPNRDELTDEEREAMLAEREAQRETFAAVREELEVVREETIARLSEVLSAEQLEQAETMLANVRREGAERIRENRGGERSGQRDSK